MNASRLEIGQQFCQVRQAPSDPVELIASQRVTLLAGGEGPSEHGTIMARSARLLDEDVLALDAELLGSVGLPLSCNLTGMVRG